MTNESLIRLQENSRWRRNYSKELEKALAKALAKAKMYKDLERAFLSSEETKGMHKALIDYGIKEPYATNIILRLFTESYKLLVP